MADNIERTPGFATQSLHAGQKPDPTWPYALPAPDDRGPSGGQTESVGPKSNVAAARSQRAAVDQDIGAPRVIVIDDGSTANNKGHDISEPIIAKACCLSTIA